MRKACMRGGNVCSVFVLRTRAVAAQRAASHVKRQTEASGREEPMGRRGMGKDGRCGYSPAIFLRSQRRISCIFLRRMRTRLLAAREVLFFRPHLALYSLDVRPWSFR